MLAESYPVRLVSHSIQLEPVSCFSTSQSSPAIVLKSFKRQHFASIPRLSEFGHMPSQLHLSTFRYPNSNT